MTLYRGTTHRGPARSSDAVPDETVAPGRRDRVARVLALHREGTDGWCGGCARAGILTFHPCPSATWAAKASREYGMVTVTEPGAGVLSGYPVSGYHGVPEQLRTSP